MKPLQKGLSILCIALMLSFTGCATSGQGGVSSETGGSSTSGNKVNITQSSSDSLTDYLRRIAGVRVIGSGPSAQIVIREKSSFNASTSPLFVINGIRAGKDFSSIYSMINPSDITDIEVLKGTETSQYGMDGANGVILINTKN